MSKKYKYIKLRTIECYEGWDLVQIIPAKFENHCDMCVICAGDTPQEDITLYADLINRQKAEIERLQKYNTEMARKHYDDGIKEFTERLCEGRVSNDPVVIAAKCLLKEMTEGTNGES